VDIAWPRFAARADSVAWPGYAPYKEVVLACRQEFVAVARAFWLIPELIPPVAREDVSLLYCFCRHLDDAIDDAPDEGAARRALGQWRDELAGRAPRRPLIAAFLAGAERNGLPLACAELLLEGMELDLGAVRIADDRELLRYAYRVSSAVGLMLAPLLGVDEPAAAQRVVDLGLALQISNILLGVEADAKRDRVYLPATRLAAAGLSPQDVLCAPRDRRLRPVLQGLADLGDRYYRSAELGASLVPLRYRHGVMLLGRAYGGLGRFAARRGQAPITPSGLPQLAHLFYLAALALSAWHPRVLGVSAPPAHDPSLHLSVAGWPGANPKAAA
jgi:phytoene synthase